MQHDIAPRALVPQPSTDAIVADIWLDVLCAIQRRGHTGTIRQALDDIEVAFERVEIIEAKEHQQ